jgi:GST-like protein
MRLYGQPGWGSAIVEAQLDWYGIDYEFEATGSLWKSAEARDRLSQKNPIVQVPTLEMDDGSIMTESAAITLLLAEMTGNDSLVPSPGSDERARFLRWLIFIVANVYPTYTYGDEPARFVAEKDAQDGYERAVRAWGERMYSVLEDHASQPWFLGERFSAIDIYLCVMSTWDPGRKWFAEHAPKLFAIATAAEQVDKLNETWKRNFRKSS